jgi:preprotein translocase subunit SecG
MSLPKVRCIFDGYYYFQMVFFSLRIFHLKVLNSTLFFFFFFLFIYIFLYIYSLAKQKKNQNKNKKERYNSFTRITYALGYTYSFNVFNKRLTRQLRVSNIINTKTPNLFHSFSSTNNYFLNSVIFISHFLFYMDSFLFVWKFLMLLVSCGL